MDIRSNRLKPLLSFRLTRKWVVRSVLLTGLLVLLKRVIAFANSLVLEISFANFLKLLKESPERIKHLQVSATDFHFSIDGKRLAMSRIVNLEDSVMQRLLDAGVDFHAAPSHIPWLSLLWSAAYAFFIWKISSRLLQGPQDEGVGKGRDKINLKPYGAL
eukprot:gene1528-2051_t